MSNGNNAKIIRQLIESAEQSLARAKAMLEDDGTEAVGANTDLLAQARQNGKMTVENGAKVVEGLFDGQNMLGPDGKQYSVPANYASKSKLVEGDRLKLTIMTDGSFVYKQIGPTERQRLIGQLLRDETSGEFEVAAANRAYKVLLASVTYFKGEVGDEIVILVPKEKDSQWAAVENIIKKSDGTPVAPLEEFPTEVAEDDLDSPV
ncbi:MAG: hypothetical protein H6760_02425 [Candidatus Nomurabacteria bacterium]|nr:MAG: hypothetical protein H6760_02425 [Candidatus Nomurabacteria bacterium]